MKNLSQINLYDPYTTNSSLEGFGPLGLKNNSAADAPNLFATFISSAVGLITIIGVIWFIFIIISGAIGIISSGGDKNSLESAKKRITNGIIGLIVTISGLIVLNFIGTILGIPTILNFADMFAKITKP